MYSFTGKTVWPDQPQPKPRGDGQSLHVPSQDWSYAVPSPPRIFVPPLDPEAPSKDSREMLEQGLTNFESNIGANTLFLRHVTRGNFKPRETILDWKYEERRQAQAVLPFLFLGPVAAARDKNFLEANGITMVMAIRDLQSAMAKLLNPKTPHELGLHVVNIDVRGTQKLIAAFPRAIEEINSHLISRFEQQQTQSDSMIEGEAEQSPGRVLIFCESGNERSATVAAAYLMAMYSVDVIPAIQILQAQRFCLAIDDTLRNLLLSYYSILKAKRDIAKDMTAHSPNPDTTTSQVPRAEHFWQREPATPTHKSSKRNLADCYDDDAMEIAGTDNSQNDLARFQDRDVQAPFTDAMEDS